MSHSSAPSETVQEADYRVVLDALAGRPLVVRTLDVGGDKPLICQLLRKRTHS